MRFNYLTVLMLWCSVVSAQEIQGRIYYQTSYFNPALHAEINDPETLPERKKNLMETIQQMELFVNKVNVLEFSGGESVYKENKTLKVGDNTNDELVLPKDLLYKNLKLKESLFATEYSGSRLIVKDTIPVYNWQLTNETKMIGNYLCYKASVKRVETEWEVTKRKDGSFSKIQIEKPRYTVAWYTTQIQISHGPNKYGGLPGIILEMEIDDMVSPTKITAIEVQINPKRLVKIKRPNKGEVVYGIEGFEKAMHQLINGNRK